MISLSKLSKLVFESACLTNLLHFIGMYRPLVFLNLLSSEPLLALGSLRHRITTTIKIANRIKDPTTPPNIRRSVSIEIEVPSVTSKASLDYFSFIITNASALTGRSFIVESESGQTRDETFPFFISDV